ncbi:MAG: class I SAM-dependent methyltransferase [Candidatus Nitrosotenuis sp.]
MVSSSSSIEYKKKMIKTWNEIAPRYHKRWAGKSVGPFQSTQKLVQVAKLRPGYFVLDLACGTGAVTREILRKIGKSGYVVGVDSSSIALQIAKRSIKAKNADFAIFDAEKFDFNQKFDVITCQYALFFFPNTMKALSNIKKSLKKNATLAIATHGAGNTVPYFSSILDSVQKFIPDYIQSGAPDLDRFGTKVGLKKVIAKAGFSRITIREYKFWYSPGTFSKYWSEYLKYLAKPLKEKLDKLSPKQKTELREAIRKKTIPYTKNGIIKFPWKVLVLYAKKL